jgi:hypothetical protein
MAEKTFRSPGFFDQEIDLSQRVDAPNTAVPAGVVGTAEKGPAFVPITVSSFDDFRTKFGDLDSKKFGPYAVNEFLKNRDAVTYVRVLGAGANVTETDIQTTREQGVVKNAGFKLDPQVGNGGAHTSQVNQITQFIVAHHFLSSSEAVSPRYFTDNDSYNASSNRVNLVRAVVFTDKSTRICVLSGSTGTSTATLLGTPDTGGDNMGAIGGPFTNSTMDGKFRLVISSSVASYGSSDGLAGIRVYTASLDPRDPDYIRNILNTDPERFEAERHLLYACFDVPAELASVSQAGLSGSFDTNTTANLNDIFAIGVVSGSNLISAGNPANQAFSASFGRFDTRYNAPRTTAFISQPFGETEFDLFHLESLDDGAYASGKYKTSIRNIRASVDDTNPYGTFTLQIRSYGDSDKSPEILEEYVKCDLNPVSERFVGRLIGDRKVTFNFDATSDSERKVVTSGKYSNKSNIARVVLSDDLVNNRVPQEALPFGFRGIPALKTTDSLNDFETPGTIARLGIHGGHLRRVQLTGSILPPVPLRFKVTNGAVSESSAFVGKAGTLSSVDGRFYWGVQTTQVPASSSLQAGGISEAALKANASSEVNQGLKDMLKFLGIEKMDVLVTGSEHQDIFNNNKFTLARVALPNQAGASSAGTYNDNELTGTVKSHMLDAAYIRNAIPDNTQYTVDTTGMANRITFGTLVAQTSSVSFNRFTDFMKFTNVFYGGFDGVNILDRNAARLNDKSTSLDTNGGAASGFTSPGLTANMNGEGKDNSGVASYRTAIDVMTDPLQVRTNILAVPGIRETFITDHAMTKNREYGQSIYLMDLPQFDDDSNRLYEGSTARVSVTKTTNEFERRTVNNNSAASYFPNVIIEDDSTGERVEVPPSVAALAALGYNDRVSFPWFAPAGFNRGALDFVKGVDVRLTAGDRDTLYDARINPIATFPQQGFVIFGQKTLQVAKSALDRVNVRRLLIEVRRSVSQVANNFVFEQNTPALRAKFVSQVSPLLAVVQAQSGIEQFKVVMDDSNNTQEDIESNRLNGRIVIVPTRTIEFISIDFIITNAGVSFE